MPVIPNFRNLEAEGLGVQVVLNCKGELGLLGTLFQKAKHTKICKIHILEAMRHNCPQKVNGTCVGRG